MPKNKQTLKTMMVVGLGAKQPKTKKNSQDHDGCRVSSQRAETQANPQHHDGCWVSSKKIWKTSKFFEVYLSSCLWQLWQHAWMSPSWVASPPQQAEIVEHLVAVFFVFSGCCGKTRYRWHALPPIPYDVKYTGGHVVLGASSVVFNGNLHVVGGAPFGRPALR